MGEAFDALVVGAGPTGLACGIELQQRGLKTVLVEKGCVVNSLYNYPTNMSFFTTPELLEIGNIPMTSLNEKPNRTEALKYYRKVAEHYHLDIHQYEKVDAITGEDNAFEVATTDRLGEFVFELLNLLLESTFVGEQFLDVIEEFGLAGLHHLGDLANGAGGLLILL